MKAVIQIENFDITIDDSDVVNPEDFIPAGESNPHNVRPWLVLDEGFTLGIAFAESLSDALDILADERKLDRFLISPSQLDEYGEEEEGISRLGNNCNPYDIENVMAFALPNPPFSFVAMFRQYQLDAGDQDREKVAPNPATGLSREVAEEAMGMIECNCSSAGCEGTCTHAKAKRLLSLLS